MAGISNLVVFGHQGLGDHIICNGLVRKLAADRDWVVLFVIKPYYESVGFMFRDLKNLSLMAIDGYDHGKIERDWFDRSGMPTLSMGYMTGASPFDSRNFDREFYRQAGIEFEHKWSGWRLDRENEIRPPKKRYGIIHESPERGFEIDRSHLNPDIEYYEPKDWAPDNFFRLCSVLENAAEIHSINTATLNLLEHLNPKGRLVFHRYAKDSGKVPELRKNWQEIR